MTQGFHEDLGRKDEVKGSSDRTFGLVFTALFALIALWPLLSGTEVRLWSLVVAGVFFALSLFKPGLLNPLNRLWMKFGLLLHKIVNPLVMGILFYLTVTPIGLIMRLMGKDPLGRWFDPAAESYWILRNPPGPAPESMKKQF